MAAVIDRNRLRNAWLGRISGCLLGKPLELESLHNGPEAVQAYLAQVDSLPLRDYVPLGDNVNVGHFQACCRGHITRSEPDDDINCTILALAVLEACGGRMQTEDVARAWLRLLPGGATFTAERHAYAELLNRCSDGFAFGEPVGFDLEVCSDNPCSDWIGAQIRADMYGWV